MAEMVLPGVYIEVRPEGLIVPGRITVGNLGVVGTARRGPVGVPVLVGNIAEARDQFGSYDDFGEPEVDDQPLSLVRGLELAFAHGATTVYAVRVTDTEDPVNNSGNLIDAWERDTTARPATFDLASAGGVSLRLRARSPGTWGNGLSINVGPAEQDAFIEDEEHDGGAAISLDRAPLLRSGRTRIRRVTGDVIRSLRVKYDGDPALVAGEVQIDRPTGDLSFFGGEEPAAGERILASYVVPRANAVKVTIRHGRTEEVYTGADGDDLIEDINDPLAGSTLVAATAGDEGDEIPTETVPATEFRPFTGGDNGTPTDAAAAGAAARLGLESLVNVDAHIIVAPGQDDSFGDELEAHVQTASSDAIRRDRIAVVGSSPAGTLTDSALVDRLRGHNVASDRVIFVAPGIRTTDTASGRDVVLPGSYAAAAVAGLLAAYSPHISLTNRTLRVGDLERRLMPTQLAQLVQNRVLALESRQGFRVVKGITTSTNTAWHQITTRRIVDYAKFGVRSAASSYIGLLNNERVRGAMRVTINSFLSEMVDDEMLISYELTVSATRDEERKGIARVTIVLRPTFSIDFIKVTMFLE